MIHDVIPMVNPIVMVFRDYSMMLFQDSIMKVIFFWMFFPPTKTRDLKLKHLAGKIPANPGHEDTALA